MNTNELFYKLFSVCLAEEFGSTEHISENITSNDIIECLEKNGNKELATLLKKLKSNCKNGVNNDELRKRISCFCSPNKYNIGDEIRNIIKSRISGVYETKLNTLNCLQIKLKGKFKTCTMFTDEKYLDVLRFDAEYYCCDLEEIDEKDLFKIFKQLKSKLPTCI